MLFDDLKINYLVNDRKLYVHVNDLSEHLKKSLDEFIHESEAISLVVPLTELEKTFIMGIASGMHNVILMLRQSNDEYGLNGINTVEELLEKFNG